MSIAETMPEPIGKIGAAFRKLLIAVRGSIVYSIWAFGILCLVSGLALQDGVMAGLLVIFGVSALIYGALGYVGLRLIGYPRFQYYD